MTEDRKVVQACKTVKERPTGHVRKHKTLWRGKKIRCRATAGKCERSTKENSAFELKRVKTSLKERPVSRLEDDYALISTRKISRGKGALKQWSVGQGTRWPDDHWRVTYNQRDCQGLPRGRPCSSHATVEFLWTHALDESHIITIRNYYYRSWEARESRSMHCPWTTGTEIL